MPNEEPRFGPAGATEAEIAAKPLIDESIEADLAIKVTSKTDEFRNLNPELSPLQGTELLEAVARDDKELFASRLGQYAPDVDAAPQYNKILDQFLTQLSVIKDNGFNKSVKNNDEERSKAYARASKDIIQRRLGLKVTDRTLHELEIESLNRIGADLDVPQKRKMLAIALGSFSATSVFRMASEWKLPMEAAGKRSRKAPSSDEINIQMVATQVMKEKLDKLRETLDELRVKGENEERRKKAMEAEKMLGYLVGSKRAEEARKMLSRHGAEVEDKIADDLAHALELSKELHSGHLDKVAVLPKTEGPR